MSMGTIFSRKGTLKSYILLVKTYGISIGNHYFLTVHLGYFSICPKNLNVHVVNNFHPGFFSIFVTKNHVTKCPCHQKFLSPYVYVTRCTRHQKCVTICTVTKWLSPYVLEPFYSHDYFKIFLVDFSSYRLFLHTS